MRISKPPEERKQEMIDTAMFLFAKKGYEATTMTDIAKEMNVVSGLCYRYFKSKEELFHEALEQYANECASPLIALMNQEYDSVEECFMALAKNFMLSDGKERYHNFFHGKGNELFHNQLEYVMQKKLEPHIIDMVKRLQEKKLIQVQDYRTTALFILYGQMQIIDDETIPTSEKIEKLTAVIKRLF